MTLKEHVAALLMAALARDFLTQANTTHCDDHFTLEQCALVAVRAADELIAAMARHERRG